MVIPWRPTDFSTTKWLISQCRMAGRRSCRDFQIQAERTADEAQLARDLDERPQGHAVKRHRVTAAKRVQIDAVPMERGHHGKAGEPAFGRLRLADQWKAPSAAEVQLKSSAHIRTLRSGVVSQLMRDRLSRMMSALRSMSGWSATRLP